MKFSIVMPVYNSAHYLDTSIASVLEQEYSCWELIAIDDGSSDNSLEKLNQYASREKRIRVFHQKNSGQFYARQKGIDNAEGEYILFLDSDDELEKYCLSELAEAVRNERPDIVFFMAEIFEHGHGKGKYLGSLGDKKRMLSVKSVKESLISSDQLNSLCFKAFSREMFEGDTADYSAFLGVHFGEDKVRVLYPVSKATKILYLPRSFYRYHQHPDSLMHVFDLEQAKRGIAGDMFGVLKRFMHLWGMEEKSHRERCEAYFIRTLLSVYYGLRRKCKNRQQLQALRRYPWETAAEINKAQLFTNRELSLRDRARLLVFYLRL